jgi:hypothetical protein
MFDQNPNAFGNPNRHYSTETARTVERTVSIHDERLLRLLTELDPTMLAGAGHRACLRGTSSLTPGFARRG